MDNEHSNDMETNSLQTGKDALPENSRQEVPVDGNIPVQDNVPEKKPGAILAARRIEAGISAEQIAARLKMTLRQVHYLETDNYEALHGIAISRGFVRAYARFLKIDPEPLVALFGDRVIPSPLVQSRTSLQKSGEQFVQNRVPFRKKNRVAGKLVIALIVLVIAAVVAWNMKLFSFKNERSGKDVPEMILPKMSPQSSPEAGMAATDAGGESPRTTPLHADAVSKTVQPVNGNAGSADVNLRNENTSVQPETAGNRQAIPVSAVAPQKPDENAAAVINAKSSQLTMDFKEKSWVQIQRKNGSVITEYIGKPGEQRQFDVNEPVTVVIGFAPGVAMKFNGAPVDLTQNTVNSVARISLK